MKRICMLIVAMMLFLAVEVVAAPSISYYVDRDGVLTKLYYNWSKGAYSLDGIDDYISTDSVFITGDNSIKNRFVCDSNGRYRILAKTQTLEGNGFGNIVTVKRNDKVVWSQFCPSGSEENVIDVRIWAQSQDKIDVDIKSADENSENLASWNLSVEKFLGTIPFCEASTSVGKSKAGSKIFLSEVIDAQESINCYSKRYGVAHPLTYNSQNNTWVDKWDGHVVNDDGYISPNYANPGRKGDTIVEFTMPDDGIVHFDGNVDLNELSDGVLVKLYHNGTEFFSNRVGGERSVRWDEPYDVSYFINRIDAVREVKEGDVIALSFNRWRKPSNDEVDISDIGYSYITDYNISKTTQWKLDDSMVIDTELDRIYINGEMTTLELQNINGTNSILYENATQIFREYDMEPYKFLHNDGKYYISIRDIAEGNGDTVLWVSDRLIIIHSGIPVKFGDTELSEIEVALNRGKLYE